MTFSSCNKNIDFTEEKNQIHYSENRSVVIDENYDNLNNDAQMILGDSIPNPYTINRMQQAFDLFNHTVSESPFTDKIVSATHHYVRITLNEIADLQVLYDFEVSEGENAPIFSMYPLHLEIIQPGDYYVDIDTSILFSESPIDFSLFPVYATVDVNLSLPTSLNVEILDKIYKPSEDEYVVKLIAYQLAGWNNYFGGFGLPDNLTTLLGWVEDYPNWQGIHNYWQDPNGPDGGGGTTGGFNCSNSHGRINVESTHPFHIGQNVNRPVGNLSLVYGRFIFLNRTTTNEEGWFCLHRRYRGDVKIRADWRRNFVSIRERWYEQLGFWLSDHIMTIRRGDISRIRNIRFANDREHLWNKATVHTGIMKYNQYCLEHGIIPVLPGTVIWTLPRAEAASNPMLNYYPWIGLLANLVNVNEVVTDDDAWRAILHHLVLVQINVGIFSLSHIITLPDQIYGLRGDRRRTERIHQTVFHESAHFSHAVQVGETYWSKVFADQLNNGIFRSTPRGNGVQPTTAGAQRIALVEGWADLADVIISLHFYEEARIDGVLRNQIFSIQRLEGFDVHDVPVNFNTNFSNDWLLHGLMWDLLDDELDNTARRRTGDGEELNPIEDEVVIGNSNDLFDLSPIFNLLTSGVENSADLRTAVLNAYPAQTTEINTLFDSYGY